MTAVQGSQHTLDKEARKWATRIAKENKAVRDAQRGLQQLQEQQNSSDKKVTYRCPKTLELPVLRSFRYPHSPVTSCNVEFFTMEKMSSHIVAFLLIAFQLGWEWNLVRAGLAFHVITILSKKSAVAFNSLVLPRTTVGLLRRWIQRSRWRSLGRPSARQR